MTRQEKAQDFRRNIVEPAQSLRDLLQEIASKVEEAYNLYQSLDGELYNYDEDLDTSYLRELESHLSEMASYTDSAKEEIENIVKSAEDYADELEKAKTYKVKCKITLYKEYNIDEDMDECDDANEAGEIAVQRLVNDFNIGLSGGISKEKGFIYNHQGECFGCVVDVETVGEHED